MVIDDFCNDHPDVIKDVIGTVVVMMLTIAPYAGGHGGHIDTSTRVEFARG